MDIDITNHDEGLVFHFGSKEVKEKDLSDSLYLNVIRVIVGLDIITNKKENL